MTKVITASEQVSGVVSECKAVSTVYPIDWLHSGNIVMNSCTGEVMQNTVFIARELVGSALILGSLILLFVGLHAITRN